MFKKKPTTREKKLLFVLETAFLALKNTGKHQLFVESIAKTIIKSRQEMGMDPFVSITEEALK